MHCNGLLTSDRQWHPHAWEAAFVQRNILVETLPQEAGQGIIRLHNEYFFRGLENFCLNWEILCNGVPTSLRGRVNRLHIGPGETRSIRLRGFRPSDWEQMQGEICLNLSFTLKRPEGLLDKGTELSWGQVLLREVRPEVDEQPLEVKAPWELHFRKADGFLNTWTIAGKDLLSDPLMPCFGRAVTENDFGAGFEQTMAFWLYPQFRLVSLNYDGNLRECEENLVCNGGPAQLEAEYDMGGEVRVRMEYRISETGTLDVDTRLDAPQTAPDLFRLGLSFAMNGRFDNLEFYGLGPFENYADRKAAARLGYYAQKVADQYHWGYVRPQESGNHEDLRWMRLTDAQGYGLCARSDTLFSGSALPLSREMLDLTIHEPGNVHYPVPLTWQKHYHSYELVPQASLEDRSKGSSWVHLDARQMGVGGINTWGEKPLEAYRIHAGSHAFHFKLTPILP
jgi:beta-galactosidase